MNRTYTRYEARTGRVVDVLDIPEANFDLYATLLYDGVIDGETHYMANGQPIERPVQQTTVDVTTISVIDQTEATLSNLPDPCFISVSGPTGLETMECQGGVLSFSAALAGTYTLTAEAFPFLPFTVNVDAL